MGKTGPDQENSRKYLPSGKKIVKIGPVDTEIALLKVKKEKKLTQAKYIALPASLPSGLKNSRKMWTCNFSKHTCSIITQLWQC